MYDQLKLVMRYAIQKLVWDVKSIVLKFPNDQTISLRIINTASEIHSSHAWFVKFGMHYIELNLIRVQFASKPAQIIGL